MVLNSLFPVFALIVLGHALKRWHLTNEMFLKTSDRLVYYIFFPAMLFWKIGGASGGAVVDWRLCQAALAALAVQYLASTLAIVLTDISDFEAGSFSQSCYRFNTYIGMAIIINAAGEEGVRQFGILIGLLIPLINVLAVSTLIWFSGRKVPLWERSRLTLTALISNPLILACIAGLIYARWVRMFPEFIDNTLRLISLLTLPLALLSVGGALTIDGLRGHFRVALAGSLLKLMLFPALGFCFMSWFHVAALPFKVGMIFFALPTSTAIYVLSSQLNSDTDLASAGIMLSTILSFASLTLVLLLF